jgi:peptide/nickel transport system substrate-binding protein
MTQGRMANQTGRPTMRRTLLAATLLIATVGMADAKTFRFAYQNDANSLDPYALNETFSHSFQANIYEPLIERDKDLKLIPALATRWEAVDATTWRFHLRPNVRFHDGTRFTADDVVFSYQRAIAPNSDVANKVSTVREIRVVDPLIVEFLMRTPNPIFPQEITTWFMFSRAWAEKNNATAPSSVRGNIENFASRNANGTGPFMIRSRQPDTRTVLVPNPAWWGEVRHNLTEVVFTPIRSDPTRVAALLSGEVDMMYPAPLQDAARIAAGGSRVLTGAELRTLFLGMDQHRDELLESNIKGRNPFKDRRVREAFYRAIDIEAIRARVMRGASVPAGLMVAPGIQGFDAALNTRLPHDPARARALMAVAGYGDGFEVGFDCPNDRYVNDEQICQAIVAMLARIGVTARLNAQTRTRYFEKILSFNTSFYILAWQPSTYDSLSPMFTVMGTPGRFLPQGQAMGGQGTYNPAGWSNARFDELTRMVRTEIDQEKRQALISEAFRIHKDDIGHIPLHQQPFAWAVRSTVQVVQRPDDALVLNWVRME